jgi:hypothetical protein
MEKGKDNATKREIFPDPSKEYFCRQQGGPPPEISGDEGLRQFLLDEEVAEVGELPGAGADDDDELDDDPADDAGVCEFGMVSEFGFSFLFIVCPG